MLAENPAKKFPDVAFILNVDDFAACPAGRCKAPVFSLFKRWDGVHDLDQDILVPFMMATMWQQLHSVPWADKVPKGFARYGWYHRGMNATCQRYKLQLLSTSEQGQGVLDVGFYKIEHPEFQHVATAEKVDFELWAKWSFLISTDGVTCSTIFGKLLWLNSVVLKYDSVHIEWFYRSLRAGVHYLRVNDASIVQTILDASDQQSDAALCKMVAKGQEFAFRWVQVPCRQSARVLST